MKKTLKRSSGNSRNHYRTDKRILLSLEHILLMPSGIRLGGNNPAEDRARIHLRR